MVPESVRIAFRKVGSLQFISHLDLMRTMKKVFIRSGIPVWYSEGFNPHPKMVFALPLSIGTESVCEKMDIKLRRSMPFDEIRCRLNAALTPELQVDEVYAPQSKFSSIRWAQYRVTYETDVSAASSLFAQSYKIMKHTKSGEAEIDIVPLIRSIAFSENHADMILDAGSTSYLNPEYVARAVAAFCNAPDYSILRQEIFFEDGVTPFR